MPWSNPYSKDAVPTRTQMKIDLLFSQKEVPPRETLLAICLNAVNELSAVRLLQVEYELRDGRFCRGIVYQWARRA
jgi:hypothetical protein